MTTGEFGPFSWCISATCTSFWLGFGSRRIRGTRERPLFSERNGITRPLLTVGPWRIFAFEVDR